MLKLVRHARRRLLCNDLLSEGANALSAALIAFILLLLFGAQVVDWRWALIIPLAAAVIGAWRALKRRPAAYEVAQILDRRAGLGDEFSTAFFFHQVDSGRGAREFQQPQYERAMRACEGVDASKAIPYAMPRTAYAMGVLLVVASSLFALRYAVTRQLDLQPPLARVLQLDFGTGEEPLQEARQARTRSQKIAQEDGWEGFSTGETAANGDDLLEQLGAQDVSAMSELKQTGAAKGKKSGSSAEEEQYGGVSNMADNNAGDHDPSASDSGENSSLWDKMKNAMEDIVSRFKTPEEGGKGGEMNAQNGEKSGQKDQQAGNNGDAKQQGTPEKGQGPQQAQAKKGQGVQDSQNTGNPDEEGSQQGFGAGDEEGNKQLREAEQLAAMGKISEIVGKRAATLTGEATVEAQSTDQQIRTPYAQRNSQHSQGGAEIGRDEVPVALQTYVQQYFEQVRKLSKK